MATPDVPSDSPLSPSWGNGYIDAVVAARHASQELADVAVRTRVQICMDRCANLYTQLIEAIRAEGTALALLPELVTRGGATAMPLAEVDQAVHDAMLALGTVTNDVHQTVFLSCTLVKQRAREVVTLGIEAARLRIQALGDPNLVLRLLTRRMLGRGDIPPEEKT